MRLKRHNVRYSYLDTAGPFNCRSQKPSGVLNTRVEPIHRLRGRPVQPSVAALRSAGGDDFGVVDQPVDHGNGDDVVPEDLAPANRGWHMFLWPQMRCDLRILAC